uniref:Uncharacterized protein n=1 Tax=Candidatus Kentrum sp. LFY TaxID=2126342 RepID=A0A450U7T1_9GAMM|nr:MAG: hypothetical protein BECKLFY1418A_GA0070994_10033 [Candidatus Kentron sp. LFY]
MKTTLSNNNMTHLKTQHIMKMVLNFGMRESFNHYLDMQHGISSLM